MKGEETTTAIQTKITRHLMNWLISVDNAPVREAGRGYTMETDLPTFSQLPFCCCKQMLQLHPNFLPTCHKTRKSFEH